MCNDTPPFNVVVSDMLVGMHTMDVIIVDAGILATMLSRTPPLYILSDATEAKHVVELNNFIISEAIRYTLNYDFDIDVLYNAIADYIAVRPEIAVANVSRPALIRCVDNIRHEVTCMVTRYVDMEEIIQQLSDIDNKRVFTVYGIPDIHVVGDVSNIKIHLHRYTVKD